MHLYCDGSKVHPRGCGGAGAANVTVRNLLGPSPRVRGSRQPELREANRSGSIPAGAGEPRSLRRPTQATRVHPRGCGGAVSSARRRRSCRGPSPRVRGSRHHVRVFPVDVVVHPRGCGGALSMSTTGSPETGPSPRVRGSLHLEDQGPSRSGSIPAGAGEPRRSQGGSRNEWVHPRGCGGASKEAIEKTWREGPSPRVRGSRSDIRRDHGRNGSIPAGAGEPAGGVASAMASRVHPRGCGGATSNQRPAWCHEGPSPRVRGSPSPAHSRNPMLGSIPAGAGEPDGPGRRISRNWVHPRGCGGAVATQYLGVQCAGPSPRVRGSPSVFDRIRLRHGSIPAGAGEPVTVNRASAWRRVHPRGCGGADAETIASLFEPGPSPRVRGSRGQIRRENPLLGSIPAGAGEPYAIADIVDGFWVHPRGCGGATTCTASRR